MCFLFVGWLVSLSIVPQSALVGLTSTGTALTILLMIIIVRRHLKFTMRELLLLVLTLGVGLGWLGSKLELARRQRNAVAHIRAFRGGVGYGVIAIPHANFESRLKLGPYKAWQVELLSEDLYKTANTAYLGGTDITNADLSHVKGLPYLEYLALGNTQITDTGLRHLKRLSKLQILVLDNTQITDAGLLHLQGIKNLRRLHLHGTQVTDEGVKKLQQALPNCKIKH